MAVFTPSSSQAPGSSGSWGTRTTHHDYPKAGSFPIHCRLLPDHAQATPAPSLHPGAPAGWQSTDMAGSAAQKPWLLQQQPKQALQLPVPVVERRDTAASAQHGAWTITPWTAAICPCGTHSNQLRGEAI